MLCLFSPLNKITHAKLMRKKLEIEMRQIHMIILFPGER